MFAKLHTTFSLDAALDLLEISDVAKSWSAAEHRNADRIADIIKAREQS